MNRRKSYLFFVLAFLYFVLHFFQHHNIGPWYIRFYAKDILLVPFLMLGIKTTTQVLGISVRVGVKELVATTLTCIFAFELIFPRLGMAFAPDFIDIICYIIGAVLYFILFLQKNRKKKTNYNFETQ